MYAGIYVCMYEGKMDLSSESYIQYTQYMTHST